SWIHATNGKRYLDFTTGIGVTSTGHCHPRVVEAAREQVGKVIHAQYTTVMHQPLLKLTERLGDVLPEGLDSVFYANSGSEAVEAAIRLARMATGRPNIVAFHGGFHGRTVAAASLTTAGSRFRSGFGPMMGGVVIAPFPDAIRYRMSEDEAVRFALGELDLILRTVSHVDDTAAFIIEPALGDGGYLPTPNAFLEGLRERADHHGIKLILDEIQSGVGRTGKFWGHEWAGVEPDILTFAKGIASGFPISGIAASEGTMSKAWPGSQGGTYGGNAVAAAAAVATLDVIRDEDLVENSRVRGAELRSKIEAAVVRYPHIVDVRGNGLMIGIEFADPDNTPRPDLAGAVQKGAIDEELLLLTCGLRDNVVRVIPPLTVSADEVEAGTERLAKVFEAVLSASPVAATTANG
ncbi:MAG TPA: aspartate aminotransferase family protein, partial [Trueperaceae bacterium]|nr:aspartate aminotransferase family protein [Trueperaceae bacterium]